MERVFEVRTYVVTPGTRDALLERLEILSRHLFHRHGMEVVGVWSAGGDSHTGDTVVCVLAHADRNSVATNWASLESDPEWEQVRRASEARGRFVHSVHSWIGEAAVWSPVK